MPRIMIAPSRYIQGPGVLADAARYLIHLGSRAFFICDPAAWSAVNERITKSLSDGCIEYRCELFSGLCTRKAAAQFSEKALAFGPDVVVGLGGGVAIDTAKAVSQELGSNLAIIPTVASNDAPCSALAIQYKEDHTPDRLLRLKRSPDLVLVDSKVISEAPVRFFVAGMGDALATWFEAFTCMKYGARNMPGGLPTNAALTMARLCLDTLMEHGVAAKLAVERKILTAAVENTIEATIMLSGLGFESGGLSSAHGIHEGLVAMEETRGMMHGELVAYGTLCFLVMENYSTAEIERVIGFCNEVGLPVTLGQVGIRDSSPEHMMRAAELVCADGLTTHDSYFNVYPELVLGAILGANALGEASLKHLAK
jgi:glycerol dehydrogenase